MDNDSNHRDFLMDHGIRHKIIDYDSEKQSHFHKIAEQIASLVTEKNAAYGDSFNKAGDILKILFPNGVKPDQYTDLLTMTRIIDKLFRIATRKDAFGESPWRDINGYSLLAIAREENS